MNRTLVTLAAVAALSGCAAGDGDRAPDSDPPTRRTTSPASLESTGPESTGPESTGPESTAPESTWPESTAATAIPDQFPIADEMVSQEPDDAKVRRAGRGLRKIAFCETRPLASSTVLDRLIAEVSAPEYADVRELMLLPDAQSASALADSVRLAAEACPVESSGQGSTVHLAISDSDVAPSAIRIVNTYQQDGQDTPGAEIMHVVPLGNALLVTSTYGEWTRGPSLDEGVAEVAAHLAPVVAAMQQFE